GLVTTILPVYNRAAMLRESAATVLAQTYRNIELIIVDDGSSDDTAALVEGLADPRIRYLKHSPNRGGNYARNRGIEAAQAPIVSFLDSDDAFLPEKAAFVLDFFARDSRIDALLDSHVLVYANGRPPRERRNPADLDPARFRLGIFNGTLTKPTPAVSARRAALIKIGGFDEGLRRRQDMDLLLRLSRKHACASSDRMLWRKHWVAGAISAERDSFIAALLAICDRHPDYLTQAEYRVGLERDLVRHFAELAAAGHWRTIARDVRRLRSDGRVRRPALRVWPSGARIFFKHLVGTR
ncbi:MAG: glycosyltransferase family 2 protein, partial [Betaproteobacteria bacterium]